MNSSLKNIFTPGWDIKNLFASPMQKNKFLFASCLTLLMAFLGSIFNFVSVRLMVPFIQTPEIIIATKHSLKIVLYIAFGALYGLFIYKFRPKNVFTTVFAIFILVIGVSSLMIHLSSTVPALAQTKNFWSLTNILFCKFWHDALIPILLWGLIHQLFNFDEAKIFYVPFFFISTLGYLLPSALFRITSDTNFLSFIGVFLGFLGLLYYIKTMKWLDRVNSLEKTNTDKAIELINHHPHDLKLTPYIGILSLIICIKFCYATCIHILDSQWVGRLRSFTISDNHLFNKTLVNYEIIFPLSSMMIAVTIGLWIFKKVSWKRVINGHFVFILVAASIFYLINIFEQNSLFNNFTIGSLSQIYLQGWIMAFIKGLGNVAIFVGLSILFTKLNYVAKTFGLALTVLIGDGLINNGSRLFSAFLMTEYKAKSILDISPSLYLVILLLCVIGILSCYLLSFGISKRSADANTVDQGT